MIKAYKNFWASYNNEVYSVYKKMETQTQIRVGDYICKYIYYTLDWRLRNL